MANYTFIRHGKVSTGISWDELQKVNMLEDGITLSPKGIEEAHHLGKSLNACDFDIIVAADSIRTRDTAKILNIYLKKPLVVEPLFNAWKASKAEFISFDDYWKAYSEFVSCNGVANGETSWENFEELQARTLRGIEKYKNYKNVLIVTHSVIISLYTGITRKGIGHCLPITINNVKCLPPDFVSLLN